jgi:hypothetical protein
MDGNTSGDRGRWRRPLACVQTVSEKARRFDSYFALGGKRVIWLDVVADEIRQNLKWSPSSDAIKEQIVAEAIAEFENPPTSEEKKPETGEPLVRGEKLSALRERTHKWGGWESWK